MPKTRRATVMREILGSKLRALRRARGIGQEALGEKAGLSGKFVGEVERGEKSISLDSLWHIAQALGTTVGTLADDRRVPPEKILLWAFLEALPPKGLSRAEGVCRAIFRSGSRK